MTFPLVRDPSSPGNAAMRNSEVLKSFPSHSPFPRSAQPPWSPHVRTQGQEPVCEAREVLRAEKAATGLPNNTHTSDSSWLAPLPTSPPTWELLGQEAHVGPGIQQVLRIHLCAGDEWLCAPRKQRVCGRLCAAPRPPPHMPRTHRGLASPGGQIPIARRRRPLPGFTGEAQVG